MIQMDLPSAFTPTPSYMSLVPETGMKQTERTHEVKFRVPPWAMGPMLECARTHLDPDPHADPILGDGYSIHTLYFDTEELDVYFRQGPYKNAKYRVRRYGAEDAAFLERKSKPQGRVRKHRTRVPLADLPLLEGEDAPEDWEGRWFFRRIRQRRLRPVCQISYDRVARLGVMDGQPVRFTLDRGVSCVRRDGVHPPERLDATPVLSDGEGIAEIKFTASLPDAFQDLVHELDLLPSSLSKYRLGIRALELAPWADSSADAQQAHAAAHPLWESSEVTD
jgi:hypothetical protein